MKSVSLKPLVEQFYLEDRRQAILQLATTANITISYHTEKKRRRHWPAKPPEKQSQLYTNSILSGKKAIWTHVFVEFYTNKGCKKTTWYKGIIIGYSKQTS